MMELIKLLSALQVVIKYDFELKDENFVELGSDEYASLQRQGGDTNKRWYRISGGNFEEPNSPPNELSIVDEREVLLIKKANAMIYEMSDDSGEQFHSFKDRLEYVREILPPELIEDE